jgi:RNA polymerase sigma-70 factor (ECF subfamily)
MSVAEQRIEESLRPAARLFPRKALVKPSSCADNEVLTPDEQCRLLAAIAMDRDRQAFALLFKHFAPRLKTFLMRSGMQGNIAEELSQETLLTVWHKASFFDPSRAGVSTWIFTIARNIRIDYQRRDRRPKPVETDPSEETDALPSGEQIMMAQERDIRVRQALRSLSEEQVTIIQLSFFNEKPHSEIARDLGIPLGTVKSRVRLAMNRLRHLLGDAS